jgi:hypothetical protein
LAFCGGEEQKRAVEHVLGDEGYDSSGLTAYIEEEFEAEVAIPSRKNANEPREIGRELLQGPRARQREVRVALREGGFGDRRRLPRDGLPKWI